MARERPTTPIGQKKPYDERLYRRGREVLRLPLLSRFSASNHLPEDDALAALFDRFLLRCKVEPLPRAHMGALLDAGWALERDGQADSRGERITDKKVLKRIFSRPAGTDTSDRTVGRSRPRKTKNVPLRRNQISARCTSGQVMVTQRP